MMRKFTLSAVVTGAFALALALPAAAQDAPAASAAPAPAETKPFVSKPVEERDVLSGKVKLDPASGYIFMSAPIRQFGQFLRVPDDESRALWEKDRLKAFAKAQKSYQNAVAQWKSDVAIATQTKSKQPEPPVEPKLETFVADPLELRDAVSFGPMNVYTKEPSFTYLQQVKPGTYIWYGNVMGGNGLPAAGTCLCMGSVKFTVKAGQITDLGNSLLTLPRWDQHLDLATLTAQQAAAKRAAAGKEPAKSVAIGVLQYGLPANLKDWPQAQAEFHASTKVNNFYGIFVSRLPPVPGVLAYHRDVVVDARTGEELASPTLVSRAKIKQ